jgi:hypothetical protein
MVLLAQEWECPSLEAYARAWIRKYLETIETDPENEPTTDELKHAIKMAQKAELRSLLDELCACVLRTIEPFVRRYHRLLHAWTDVPRTVQD